MAHDFNLNHRILADGFPKGAMVMKKVDVRGAKSDARYEGPFKVLDKTKGNTYVLLDATQSIYQKKVPADQLKLISVPAEILQEEESYEVERVIGHKGPRNNRVYLVKWKDYPEEDNSWVPVADFDTTEAIEAYWKTKKNS